ncbi:hypothetical protein AAF134_13385 [Synechococcus lacustris Tous-12m]
MALVQSADGFQLEFIQGEREKLPWIQGAAPLAGELAVAFIVESYG